jgi:hypothetical protein
LTTVPSARQRSALLRHTTGFCIGNFYARGVGVLARTVFAGIDAATISAFEAINFSLDEGRRELARLPTANGGFGLRSIADHCGIAFVAATVAAHELFQHFSRNKRATNSHGLQTLGLSSTIPFSFAFLPSRNS